MNQDLENQRGETERFSDELDNKNNNQLDNLEQYSLPTEMGSSDQ